MGMEEPRGQGSRNWGWRGQGDKDWGAKGDGDGGTKGMGMEGPRGLGSRSWGWRGQGNGDGKDGDGGLMGLQAVPAVPQHRAPCPFPPCSRPRRTLADIIMEKITEKQTEVETALSEISGCPMPQLDPRVLEVYKGVREVKAKELCPVAATPAGSIEQGPRTVRS